MARVKTCPHIAPAQNSRMEGYDAVLRGGAVPLSVLEDQIDLWLEEQGAS